MAWEKIAEDKKARIAASIPPEWRITSAPTEDSVMDYPKKSGIMTAEELAITESSATDLVAKMAEGQLTSVAVTTAFCKRAALATQLTNCTLEFFPEIALARAKELDESFKMTGKVVGPLHGLPISLKDQFRIKVQLTRLGLETSMGYVAWIGRVDKADSVLVTLLLKAGAVFYVKTSVPQSLMVCETVNNVIGRTVNPRNKNWSCGGSSGGEGAMVGFRGGIIGVGTDIGGSIRVPSAFNFLYGLRPSHGRLPYANMANSMEGQETVHSNIDMRLFVTSVLAEEPWKYDSKVIPMPWRQSEADAIKTKLSSGGLTLGYYDCDGVVLPHPPILRGVDTVVSTLKAAVDMNELWDAQLQKWAYQSEYLEQFRLTEETLGKEIDAIIAPITPTAAIRHNQFKYYGYASTINLLDFTSVVVPVTWADKNVDKKKEGYKALSDIDGAVQAECEFSIPGLGSFMLMVYVDDPEAYDGAPVAVQIVGRRLTEERIMAIAEEIGRLLGNEITP
ncbi:Acetamidase [Lachnellula occidentalis]|uniref:amidase n=1 Tax=Lachnellula occidentalis TaxID=215460 RepID=A0A8H8U4T8_9HELO|nr:Acetamidase [Lachnellula occidentalis]